MHIWFATLFDSIFSLPWRQLTADEVIRAETESRPNANQTSRLCPAATTIRAEPPKPSTDPPHRRGIH